MLIYIHICVFRGVILEPDDEVGNQEVPSKFYGPAASHAGNSSRPAHSSSSTHSLVQLSSRHHLQNDPNWQQICKTIRERNAVMFNNDLMADCYFKVGIPPAVQKIPAHKYILATGSSVFFAMFYGGLADQDDKRKEIEIPDVEPAAFLNLLK